MSVFFVFIFQKTFNIVPDFRAVNATSTQSLLRFAVALVEDAHYFSLCDSRLAQSYSSTAIDPFYRHLETFSLSLCVGFQTLVCSIIFIFSGGDLLERHAHNFLKPRDSTTRRRWDLVPLQLFQLIKVRQLWVKLLQAVPACRARGYSSAILSTLGAELRRRWRKSSSSSHSFLMRFEKSFAHLRTAFVSKSPSWCFQTEPTCQ